MDTSIFYNCPVLEDRGPMFVWLAASGLLPNGYVNEYGVASGGTLNILTQLFAHKHDVHGFDSFAGLPETWDMGGVKGLCGKGTFACEPPIVEDAIIIPGLFSETLPKFRWDYPLALAHIDCDIYSSTKTVIEHLKGGLQEGTIIICDELRPWLDEGAYPNWREHEAKAMQELDDYLQLPLGLRLHPLVRGRRYSAAFRITYA